MHPQTIPQRVSGKFTLPHVQAWAQNHQTVCAALVLAAILQVCFFPFIWGDKTLLTSARDSASILPRGAATGNPAGPSFLKVLDPGAGAWVTEPYASLIRQQYLTERNLPLWNPYQAYGSPLAADMQSQPFNPLYLIFCLSPTPRAYNFFILLRLFIAGISAYLYARIFLRFAPSLVAGVVCMLSGYYILFYNMPHLSVDMLGPSAILSAELLLRRKDSKRILVWVVIVILSILGGMPESAFLLLAFSSLYVVFRILADASLRSSAGAHLVWFASVTLIGIALSAFLILPFTEFLGTSFDVHQAKNVGTAYAGLRHYPWNISAATYLIPLLFGPAYNDIRTGTGGHTGISGFYGIMPLMFALIAGGWLLFGTRTAHGERARKIGSFFLGAAVLISLKKYGCPAVQWLGALPVVRMVGLAKYDEVWLAVSISVLCGLGVELVLERQARRSVVMGAVLAVAGLVVSIWVASSRLVAGVTANRIYYDRSLAGASAVLALSGTIVCLWCCARPAKAATRKRWVAGAIVALLTVEMTGNYIWPVFYIFNQVPDTASDPYRGAAYINFLRGSNQHNYRVFGRDLVLFPNWASAFQLFDIRGLDAIYYVKYLPFVRTFVPGPPGAINDDPVDRFTGNRPYRFTEPLERRLLQLSSVKYIVSQEPYAEDSRLAERIVEKNLPQLAPSRSAYVGLRTFSIDGVAKTVLFEHPPYERLPWKTLITPGREKLSFAIALDPAVYTGTICGEGVEFRLEVRDDSGSIHRLYDRYIDPKHQPSERRWFESAVDLEPFMGTSIEFLFSTLPGPRHDTCAAWGGWGGLRFSGEAVQLSPFRLVYQHRDAKVYEYDHVLPRAAIFYGAEVAADEGGVLRRLADPALDIFQTAVINSADLGGAERHAIELMDSLPGRTIDAAIITSYTSQRVRIEAKPDRPALIVLNDSDYPGWQAYVDGRPARWITVDYLFRGVFITPGRHVIEYKYAPASFRFGMWISGGGLLSLAVIIWQRRHAGSEHEEREIFLLEGTKP
jgi:hypothetical protein